MTEQPPRTLNEAQRLARELAIEHRNGEHIGESPVIQIEGTGITVVCPLCEYDE